MTGVDISGDQDRAGRTGTPARLADLVGDLEPFTAGVRGRLARSYRCEAAPRLLTPADIWTRFDCGLLVAPYFGVLLNGVAVPLADVTVTRVVLKRRMAAYARAAAVRERFDTGHTVRLARPDHWHPGIKDLVAALRDELRAEAGCEALLSPPGAAGARAGGGAGEGETFLLQLDGRATAVVGAAGESFTLRPGDVLYVPGGRPYTTTAGDGGCLHLAVTVQQPTPRDLAELALARFLQGPRTEEVAGTHHFMTIDEKVGWLRTELAAHLAAQDDAELVAEAVKIRRRTGQA
ncbi:JmjC domain-containing protein [Streptantibioticus silvisoli]|uniref:Cupin domain-containing protein n=1 Tax=Streptantibioticus silvisoli TaxID=2705255 RepID=A0ABT6W7B5_9ACTN|nr:cupin domain-containing protein [Streptantibioticus silvisoli]MDI5966641.1 cupin domain-containing protein [Streptantibioticus silvisoli]